MKRALAILPLLLAGITQAEAADTITAHVTGRNYGKVDKTIVVTAKKQKVFHLHSDFEGGGTWYDAFVYTAGEHVTILERDSVSTRFRSGSKATTVEHIYRLPVGKIEKETVDLRHGNRIVLTRSEAKRPPKPPIPGK
jgi:hypothetical protein